MTSKHAAALSSAAAQWAKRIVDGSVTLAEFDKLAAAVSERMAADRGAMFRRPATPPRPTLAAHRAPAPAAMAAADPWPTLPPVSEPTAPTVAAEPKRRRRAPGQTSDERATSEWILRTFSAAGVDVVAAAEAASAEWAALKSRGPAAPSCDRQTYIRHGVERFQRDTDAQVLADRAQAEREQAERDASR